MRARFAAILALAASSACAHPQSVVDLGVGRVVVYRNGVAYFERRAIPSGDTLSITVAKDMVDDFLKSLTVRDAATGQTLPVSFPTRGSERGQLVEITVRLPARVPEQLVMTYLAEAPAWKPSYRIVVDDQVGKAAKGEVSLEGWAVVDNTTGEPWHDVIIGVGSSSALSFRYDLWSVRDVHRQTLASEERFATAPPIGGSTYQESEGSETVVGELAADQINVPVTHPDDYTRNIPVPGRTFEAALGVAPGVAGDDVGVSFSGVTSSENYYVVDGVNTTGLTYGTTSGGARADPEAERLAREANARAEREAAETRRRFARNERMAAQLADQLKRSQQRVVIEGYAEPADREPEEAALDRANVLRNQLIDHGVAPAQLEVRAIGVREGRPAGVRLVAATAGDDAGGAQVGDNGSPDDQPPVGESHFTSTTRMSVAPDTSAMVTILRTRAKGELVYLYDAESARGNDRYAFKAVRLLNPTDNTLEAGPVTVYRQGGFIGEGLTEPIPAESWALIPFALDRQIVVERVQSRGDHITGLSKLVHGVLTADVQHQRETALKLTNRSRQSATVYARHCVQAGWSLVDAPQELERQGDAYLLAIELAPRQTKVVRIREATPMVRRFDLRGEIAINLVDLFLSSDEDHLALREKLRPLVVLHRAIARRHNAIGAMTTRLDEYRVRMDELHGQIRSLTRAKTRSPLLSHLEAKFREVSDRVQQTTFALVEEEQRLFLERLEFLDAIADLSI